MLAVLLQDYDNKPQSISVTEVPLLRPGPGQVLIRIAASPVNPADIVFMRGLYGFKKALPAIPGLEGSGTVIAAGSGLLPRFLLGRRVACSAADPDITGGTWAQYLVTHANRCIPLRKEVTTEQGATLLINPMTAWGLLEHARRGGHRAVVQSAAAGALGRMIVRLSRQFSITMINIVRRPEQEDLLRKLGAGHVLNENTPGFDAALRDLCHTLHAGIGFDAVAGEMSARMLRAQPEGSRLLVYGALSMKPPQIDPSSLIFERKGVEGFWLSSWLRTKNTLSVLGIARKVQKLLNTDLSTDIQARLPLEEFARGIQEYKHHMTRGKVLFVETAL
jgi:NADPH:quinone reductase-like Zn-dependent oxidoreductase